MRALPFCGERATSGQLWATLWQCAESSDRASVVSDRQCAESSDRASVVSSCALYHSAANGPHPVSFGLRCGNVQKALIARASSQIGNVQKALIARASSLHARFTILRRTGHIRSALGYVVAMCRKL